jgi:hypothetical protein
MALRHKNFIWIEICSYSNSHLLGSTNYVLKRSELKTLF